MIGVWREELSDCHIEWHGKHALGGEARYFQEWEELIGFLRECVGLPIKQSKSRRRHHA